MGINLFRDIILNLILLTVFIYATLLHFGIISLDSPGQQHQKAVKTLDYIQEKGCTTSKELRNHLNHSIIHHELLIKEMQKKKLILHYECGLKTTLSGSILSRRQNWQFSQLQEEPIK